MVPVPEPEKIDHELIVEKVFELLSTGKKKLSIKHLDDFNEGLEQTIAPIRHLANGFRGGGDTVIAGTNVVITSDASGKKVINALGGGFTILLPTETPNGTLAVFTFPSATAKPSYLVVDYAQKPATAKNGSVNWTWNNSTKQATLSTPPQEDLYAIQ